MNTTALKTFAPAVRIQLMEAVTRKLDFVLTAQTPDYLTTFAPQVEALRKLADNDRAGLVERVAYTWFNRLAALRFLDARGWHPFRARVLTPVDPEETQPELLKLMRTGALPEELKSHTDPQRLNDLLDGRIPSSDAQGEVYRHLVLAACRFYHELLPSLFEELDDETELLLPDDLLTEQSVTQGFRSEISDDDCSEVEILGWLYQFYISEKKDAVMARKKAVPSEDIPAVTQLFTPHWIVRYLVENSLGRLWLRSRPNSRLREHMPYYVEDPEGQTPADSLTVATPEEIRLLDPACGSGHMLTYGFDLLVKIYEEEGHAPSEIPEKILTHNLFGLEICPRAAQLAQFALVCKAREQSRRAFRNPIQPQIMRLRDVRLSPEDVNGFCDATGTQFSRDELSQIHQFRKNSETFGSLIQPKLSGKQLSALRAKIGKGDSFGDSIVEATRDQLHLAVDQGEMLSQRYQVVVANPPYMGFKGMNDVIKELLEDNFDAAKADLFAAFMARNLSCVRSGGYVSMVTMHSWMFLPSFQDLRPFLRETACLETMAHLGPNAFDTISGEIVQTTAFIYRSSRNASAPSTFFRLVDGRNEEAKRQSLLARENQHVRQVDEFDAVTGSPLVYWMSERAIEAFSKGTLLEEIAKPRQGMATADNDRFLRFWFEVSAIRSAFVCKTSTEAMETGCRWFPYNKGGRYRKWYGNNEFVVNWENDGYEIRNFLTPAGKQRSAVRNAEFYFRRGITWTTTTSNSLAVRFSPGGFLFDVKGSSLFPERGLFNLLGFLGSPVANAIMGMLNPTTEFQVGNMSSLPFKETCGDDERCGASVIVESCSTLARADWDNFETSWNFRDVPLLRPGEWEVEPGQSGGAWKSRTLAESWANYASYCAAAIRRMQELETENNRLWIDAYGLQDELAPAVPEDEITLARADKKKDVVAFLSYAVGCMMGRYSLDQPGLILADAGDSLKEFYQKVGKSAEEITFVPDEDAIIPVLEGEWFEDDIVARTREFLRVTFGEDTLRENIRFIEDSLGKDLRKYFLTDFYKDHLQTYKKRPIYWLVQSPKKGFSVLIYLHRYTRDTMNGVLNRYLRDYQAKLRNRLPHLEQQQSTATTAKAKTEARKEADKITKTLHECEEWERQTLLPLAQARIELDLDEGVKVNYLKLGEALAPIAGLKKKAND